MASPSEVHYWEHFRTAVKQASAKDQGFGFWGAGDHDFTRFHALTRDAMTAVSKDCRNWIRDDDVVAVDVGFKTCKDGTLEYPAKLWKLELPDGRRVRISDHYFRYLKERSALYQRLSNTEDGVDHTHLIDQPLLADHQLFADHFMPKYGPKENGASNSDSESNEASSTSKQPIHDLWYGPWIRVHVQHKIEPENLREERKFDYSKELIKGRKEGFLQDNKKKIWYPVHVIEGPYEPSAGSTDFKLARPTQEEVKEWRAENQHIQGDERFLAFHKLILALQEGQEQLRQDHADSCDRQTDYASRLEKLEPLRKRVDRRAPADPLVGGVSFGNARGSWGTLGAVVWDCKDGNPCILSNWHVIVGSGAGKNELCLQPAIFDGGRLDRDGVATVERWRCNEHVDAALAKLVGNRTPLIGKVADQFQITGEPIQKIDLGLKLRKSGRATGVTDGIVDGVGMTVKIQYGDGEERIPFRDQIHIIKDPDGRHTNKDLTQKGDSGAVWFRSDGRPAALQFAGDKESCSLGEFAIANPMHYVMEELDFSFEEVYKKLERKETEEMAPGGQPTTSLGGAAMNTGGKGSTLGVVEPPGVTKPPGIQDQS